MQFNVCVLLLALLAVGVVTKTLSLEDRFGKVSPTDPAFLQLNDKIRETFPNMGLDHPVVIVRSSNSVPRTWSVKYLTSSGK